jgi:hypothetical protein
MNGGAPSMNGVRLPAARAIVAPGGNSMHFRYACG